MGDMTLYAKWDKGDDPVPSDPEKPDPGDPRSPDPKPIDTGKGLAKTGDTAPVIAGSLVAVLAGAGALGVRALTKGKRR